MDKKNIKRKVIDFLNIKIEPYFAYIFGSFNKKTFNSKSDIDIAYLSKNIISSLERYELQQELSCILNRDIDLINIEEVSTVLQKEIIQNGTIIINKNNYKKIKFEALSLSKYVRLNEERKEIIKNLQLRGI